MKVPSAVQSGSLYYKLNVPGPEIDQGVVEPVI
jgi:hypothetical protein